MENRYEIYLPCVLQYCISIEYSVLTVFVFCRTEREPHRGGRTHTFTTEQRYHTVYSTVLFFVCTKIKLFLLCIFVCCFMFDYEKSRPTLRHFTKGEMAHSPESLSFMVFHFDDCVFNFALQCAVNAW